MANVDEDVGAGAGARAGQSKKAAGKGKPAKGGGGRRRPSPPPVRGQGAGGGDGGAGAGAAGGGSAASLDAGEMGAAGSANDSAANARRDKRMTVSQWISQYRKTVDNIIAATVQKDNDRTYSELRTLWELSGYEPRSNSRVMVYPRWRPLSFPDGDQQGDAANSNIELGSQPAVEIAAHSEEQRTNSRLAACVQAAAMNGKARQAVQRLTGHGLVPLQAEGVEEQLRSKYPAPPVEAQTLPRLPGKMPPPASTSAEVARKRREEEEERFASFNREVWVYLRERSYGTGGAGMSGLTYKALRLAYGADGDKECTAVRPLSRLMQLILDGRFDHPRFRPFFSAQRGVALDKGNGAARPIGILEVLTRLASGVVTKMNKGSLAALMHQHDWGSGLPGGTEAVGHALTLYHKIHAGQDHVTIKTDIRNAFQEIDRRLVIEAVNVDSMRPLHGYINTIYGHCSTVTFTDKSGKRICIVNAQGVVQGDPMASWLFDAAYSKLIQPVRDAAKDVDVFIITIHDDTYINGPAEAAFGVYDSWLQRISDGGLTSQAAKCTAFALSPSPAVQPLAAARNIPLTTTGIEVAGAPVGTEGYVADWVRDKTDAIIVRLQELELSYRSITLPRGTPKLQGIMRAISMCVPSQFNHVMRSLSPVIVRPHAMRLDKEIVRTVLRMVGHGGTAALQDENGSEWSRVSRCILLPCDQGGAGFHCSTDACDAAYTASWALTGGLVQRIPGLNITDPSIPAINIDNHLRPLSDAIQRLRDQELDESAHVPVDVKDAIDSNASRLQASLCAAIAKKKRLAILQDVEDRPAVKARLLSATGDSSWAWLTAAPGFVGKRMQDGDFRIALQLRLHLPITLDGVSTIPTRCTDPKCQRQQDAYGDHAFRCKASGAARTRRHTDVLRQLHHVLFSDTKVKGAYEVRPDFSMTDAGWQRKQASGPHLFADLAIRKRDGSDSTYRAIDLVITHPAPDVAGQHDEGQQLGAAAARAEKAKHTKYGQQYHFNKEHLIPVAIETLGTLGTQARQLIKEVADVARPCDWVVDESGKLRPVDWDAMRSLFIRDLRERVAVALQIGNARVVRCWGKLCCKPSAAGAGAAAAADAEDVAAAPEAPEEY